MTATDRTPCMNPRCRRTGDAAKFPGEMICGHCFRTLPTVVRSEFRRLWREHRKWERRAVRTSDELEARRKRAVSKRFGDLINRLWRDQIKPFFTAPEKPAGLDAFLEEMGL